MREYTSSQSSQPVSDESVPPHMGTDPRLPAFPPEPRRKSVGSRYLSDCGKGVADPFEEGSNHEACYPTVGLSGCGRDRSS